MIISQSSKRDNRRIPCAICVWLTAQNAQHKLDEFAHGIGPEEIAAAEASLSETVATLDNLQARQSARDVECREA